MLVEGFKQLTRLTELWIFGPLPNNAYSPVLELPMLEILRMGFKNYSYSSVVDDGIIFTPTSDKLTSLTIHGGQPTAVILATYSNANFFQHLLQFTCVCKITCTVIYDVSMYMLISNSSVAGIKECKVWKKKSN